MLKIGITGGVGSGKTVVLKYLEDKYNAMVVVADEVAHLLEAKGMPCYNELIKKFGNEILGDDEEIDKKKFAEVLFRDSANTDIVNSIVHPAVNKYIFDKMKEAESSNVKIFIVEAALLIENGYDKILDELWYVYVSKEVRRIRLKENRGYSDDKINRIFASQMDEEEYKKYCKYVIINDGNVEDTYLQIDNYIKNKMIFTKE